MKKPKKRCVKRSLHYSENNQSDKETHCLGAVNDELTYYAIATENNEDVIMLRRKESCFTIKFTEFGRFMFLMGSIEQFLQINIMKRGEIVCNSARI